MSCGRNELIKLGSLLQSQECHQCRLVDAMLISKILLQGLQKRPKKRKMMPLNSHLFGAETGTESGPKEQVGFQMHMWYALRRWSHSTELQNFNAPCFVCD